MIWPDRQPGTESTQPEPTSPPHARPSVPSYRYNLRSRPQRITRNPTLARLHVLLPAELDADVYHHRQHRGYLRELVYGAKYYRAANDYAPLKEDGTVDWHLVNAVGTVMSKSAIGRSDDSAQCNRRTRQGRGTVATSDHANVEWD